MKSINFFNIALAINIIMVCGFLHAEDTTILKLTGNIKASPCVVDSASLSVDLGDYYVDSTSTQTEQKFFAVNLNSCPTSTTNVTVTFSGSPSTITSETDSQYANAGTAQGVVVDIRAAGVGMGNGKTKVVRVTSGTTSVTGFARMYIPDKTKLTLGTVDVSVTLTFTYS